MDSEPEPPVPEPPVTEVYSMKVDLTGEIIPGGKEDRNGCLVSIFDKTAMKYFHLQEAYVSEATAPGIWKNHLMT